MAHEYSKEEKEELKMLAENIVHYRKQAEKTQKEVATELGIEKSNYQKYERGVKNISVLVLKELATAIETTSDKLLKRRKEKTTINK